MDNYYARKQLYYWQYGSGRTNFHSILYLLFQKADPTNYNKLKRGFPEEASAYEEWIDAPSQDKLFRDWGFFSERSSDE